MRSLYDVNCLLALLDRHHAAHATVAGWFAANTEHGWASCPLTQNGCVRILSQPRYPHPLSVVDAMDLLRAAVSSEYHQFIPDDARLVTRDTHIPLDAVQGANESHLVVI